MAADAFVGHGRIKMFPNAALRIAIAMTLPS